MSLMYGLTVRDIGNYKRPCPRLKGVRIDFRWSTSIGHDEREQLTLELIEMLKAQGLTMSGFGKESYSGIISIADTSAELKRKLEQLTTWLTFHKDRFKLFRTGKIQWVEDIFFE